MFNSSDTANDGNNTAIRIRRFRLSPRPTLPHSAVLEKNAQFCWASFLRREALLAGHGTSRMGGAVLCPSPGANLVERRRASGNARLVRQFESPRAKRVL